MADARLGLQIGEIARRIAEVDLSAPVSARARQCRGFVQAGVIVPIRYRGVGLTAAAEFDAEGLCAARILCTLADMGFTIRLLRDAAAGMSAPARKEWPPGKVHPAGGLTAMVAGLHAGEDWDFVLQFKRALDGKRTVVSWFEPVSPGNLPLSSRAIRMMRAADIAEGVVRVADIRLPCRDDLAPLLGLPVLTATED